MDMDIPYTVEVRPDTGLTNGKLGIWLFLASEVMLFGALFSTYIILRIGRAGVAARRAERPARHVQHVRPDRLVGDDGDGVGVAEAARLGQAPALSGATFAAGGASSWSIKYFEYAEHVRRRRAAVGTARSSRSTSR